MNHLTSCVGDALGKYYIEYVILDGTDYHCFKTREFYMEKTAWRKGKFEVFKMISRYPNGKLTSYKFIKNANGKLCTINKIMPLYTNRWNHL